VLVYDWPIVLVIFGNFLSSAIEVLEVHNITRLVARYYVGVVVLVLKKKCVDAN
jgi:hypothetical protein